MGLGRRELNDLIEYYKDRYDPAELVEHLGIEIDDLIAAIESWLEGNPEKIQADLEHINKFEDN